MRELQNPRRIFGIMDRIIDTLNLDLTGLTVLTEAASGPFVCTPLLAARAGAKVIAVTRSSEYGSVDDVSAYTKSWANRYGVSRSIIISSGPVIEYAPHADILTNLGFLRPINAEIINLLPDHAVIPLMWEAWEFRSDDLDLAACRRRGIPVVGTCETHPALRIFDYLGMVVVKLLLEIEVEVMHSRIALVASDPFGKSIEDTLVNLGAQVFRIPEPKFGKNWEFPNSDTLDALVVAEHRSHRQIIGSNGGISVPLVQEIGSPVIHICGNLDIEALRRAGVKKYPSRQVRPGYMAVTTDYCGPRPVIHLHAGGLKVGEIMARSRKAGLSVRAAEDATIVSGLGSLLVKEGA